ncbi:hypothetical protein B0H16DRAFT_1456673 [Mycena metata]|uniref:Uncharacterized protein n=1 Tax=Mycena metata TaxID=1033252 RepID=A0AAD7JBW9_9AGAR|nr:hypothetical protein B0H16DRAFT_1456673 [Mycena metata]
MVQGPEEEKSAPEGESETRTLDREPGGARPRARRKSQNIQVRLEHGPRLSENCQWWTRRDETLYRPERKTRRPTTDVRKKVLELPVCELDSVRGADGLWVQLVDGSCREFLMKGANLGVAKLPFGAAKSLRGGVSRGGKGRQRGGRGGRQRGGRGHHPGVNGASTGAAGGIWAASGVSQPLKKLLAVEKSHISMVVYAM